MSTARAFIKSHPTLTFYALVFAISWGGMLLVIGGPGGIPGTSEQVERLLPFVLLALFAGPSLAGILMTGLISGRAGLGELLSRLLRWRVGARWYAAAILTAPFLVAAVLLALSLLSPEFLPGLVTTDDKVALVLFGIGWGLVGGGFLEELGWTGFAVPRLRLRYGASTTGLIVGLLWGAWHLLVAIWGSSSFSGGRSLVTFVAGFLLFYVGALPAYRVLMVWVYDRTGSLLVAMLMHASLSASTLILQPVATGMPYLTWNLVLTAALWGVVAAVAVANRRQLSPQPRPKGWHAYPRARGKVAKGFEEVRVEFERNFAERGEIGAAVSAYWRGENVVDLWGGRRSPDDDAPWEEDTLVVVHSTTKGISAMTLAVANARGYLDYDAPIARYWPEFAQGGKEAVTVRQLLGHEAGLVWLDEDLSIERLRDLDDVARVLARQKPAWAPGTRHGYHAMTIGLYMQELVRRVDPAHRTLGAFFREEIADPLGLEFFIGLPPEISAGRLATLLPFSTGRALRALPTTPRPLLLRVLWPWSLLRKSMLVLSDVDPNDRRYLEVEVPAGNGVGTARAIARLYSAFAEGGAELGVGPDTMARITAPPTPDLPKDVVMGVPSYYSLGFLRPGPDGSFGSSPRAFGTPGAGGSFAFADPDARLGYAYVMNKMDFFMFDDPREKALRDAVYRAIATLGRGSSPRPSRAPREDAALSWT